MERDMMTLHTCIVLESPACRVVVVCSMIACIAALAWQTLRVAPGSYYHKHLPRALRSLKTTARVHGQAEVRKFLAHRGILAAGQVRGRMCFMRSLYQLYCLTKDGAIVQGCTA